METIPYVIMKSIQVVVGSSFFLCKLAWHVDEIHIDLTKFHGRPESNNVIVHLAFVHYVRIYQNLRTVVTIQHFGFLLRTLLFRFW